MSYANGQQSCLVSLRIYTAKRFLLKDVGITNKAFKITKALNYNLRTQIPIFLSNLLQYVLTLI